MSPTPAAMDVATRPVRRGSPGRIPLRERLLFAIVLMLGGLLMLAAGQFALEMPRTWQINDTNMESKLNPNEVYALYHKEGNLQLAAIRTDIPNLLSTPQDSNPAPSSFLPPSVVEFKAPVRIATTTPFPIAAVNTALPTAGPAASATPPAAVPPEAPTFTLEPTDPPLPTSTLRPTRVPTRTPTRAPTRTPTRVPTRTPTRVPTLIPTRTPTAIPTPTLALTPFIPATPSGSPTPTHTLVNTLTLTLTNTPTLTPTFTRLPSETPSPTATQTLTPTSTHTFTPTPTATTQTSVLCPITGLNQYDIPVGGCTITYDTTSPGVILSLDLRDPGSLVVSWYGLPENPTSGACAAQASNLTKGKSLTNIAVGERSNAITLTFGNTTKTMTVHITVTDWTTGCN